MACANQQLSKTPTYNSVSQSQAYFTQYLNSNHSISSITCTDPLPFVLPLYTLTIFPLLHLPFLIFVPPLLPLPLVFLHTFHSHMISIQVLPFLILYLCLFHMSLSSNMYILTSSSFLSPSTNFPLSLSFSHSSLFHYLYISLHTVNATQTNSVNEVPVTESGLEATLKTAWDPYFLHIL